MATEHVWIAGTWRAAVGNSTFTAENPATGEKLPGVYPQSSWEDCDAALTAAAEAAIVLRSVSGADLEVFLEGYAAAIEAKSGELVEMAHAETGLPIRPRLQDVELPRATTQLRQAAAAAREGSWQNVIIDTKNNIRSHYAPIGPVIVFGPNNFPFAFNGVSGGDFAAAIAAGCPVIAKAHPLHPGTSKLLAQCASEALTASKLPPATVQMLFGVANEDGLRMVSDPRVGAACFTGSRAGGLRLKAAADAAGNVMYLEMSSLNPVVLLPGVIAERGEAIATELADSCLAASGQFCTSPNLILAIASEGTEKVASALAVTLEKRPAATLLSQAGLSGLDESVQWLIRAGAEVATGGTRAEGGGWRYKNTLLRISAKSFLDNPLDLQREAFGNATMLIIAGYADQLVDVLEKLEGNLTGSIYSSIDSTDDEIYAAVAKALRYRVGRLLSNKMPTGVALSPAMNHGGPFPSTSHPGFTAVGIPRSMLRFGALHCYDNVRQERLPPALRDLAPESAMWRMVDAKWTRG